MDPVRFGIIGTGSASHRYYGKACRALGEAELVAAYDLQQDRAQEFADEYGCEAVPSLDALLARDDVEAVFVATQVWHHCEPTVTSCRAGKHVLCEKPMATTLDEAERMIAAAREAGVLLGGIFQMRCSNHFAFLRDRIAEGLLGELQSVELTSRWPYSPDARKGRPDLPGILVNMMIHSIDFTRGVCGEIGEIEFARVEHLHPDMDPPFEDLVMAEWRFENGARGLLNGCCSSPAVNPVRKREILIIGDRGCAVLGDLALTQLVTVDDHGNLREHEIPPRGETSHDAQIRDFAEAIREERPPLVSGEEHRATLRVLLEILEKGKRRDPGRAS